MQLIKLWQLSTLDAYKSIKPLYPSLYQESCRPQKRWVICLLSIEMYSSVVAAAGDWKIKRLNSFGTRGSATLNAVKCKNLLYVHVTARPLAIHKGADKLHICRVCKLSKITRVIICSFSQWFYLKIFSCVSENFAYQNILTWLQAHQRWGCFIAWGAKLKP